MDAAVFVSVGAFVAVLVLIVALRARNKQLEIRATDIAVAALPVLIYLLVTGRIHSFEVAGVKLESAFNKATAAPVSNEATPVRGLLKAEPISLSAKGAAAISARRLVATWTNSARAASCGTWSSKTRTVRSTGSSRHRS
jgi:hypothetical protein